MESGSNPCSDLGAKLLRGVQSQPRGWNRWVHDHFRLPAPYIIRVRLQCVPRAVQGDGNDRHPRLNRQIKGASLKRPELPIAAAVPLRKKHHRAPGANPLAGDLQASKGLPRTLALDRAVARAPQVPAQKREVKSRPIREESETDGEMNQQHR